METYEKMKTDADEAATNARRYFELQVERLKLELVERLTVSLTDLIFALIMGLFVFVGLFLACVIFGLIVQQFADNWIISAGSAAGFFGLLAWFVIRRGRTIVKDVIAKILIQSIYE